MDDLTAVLDDAGVERGALFGFSEGALMCALFAATHPARTRALIMYGCYARGLAADDYPWAPTPEQVDLAVQMIEADWGHGAFLDLYAPSAAGNPNFARWWAHYERVSASPAMATAVVRQAAETDIRGVLPAISVPTLILHRRGDQLLPIEGARYAAAHIPGAHLVELDGIDHFPFAGDTEALLDEVESFLTGTRHAPDLNRQLLTVLFTDIVGSTERAAELGDRCWRALLETHDAGRTPAAQTLSRRGDQDDWRRLPRNLRRPRPRSPMRPSDHASLPASSGSTYAPGFIPGSARSGNPTSRGMAVNIGARVCALADSGEVLVSNTVKDLVVGSAITFEPRGSRPLKGVPGEWPLFAAAGT